MSQLRIRLRNMFNTITNSFRHLSTDYKIFKHFKTCGEYIPSKDYLISHRLERVKTQKGIQAKQVPVYGQFIELKKVLQKFFELPDSYESTISYIESLKENSDYFSNFIQSSLWKQNIASYKEDEIILFCVL